MAGVASAQTISPDDAARVCQGLTQNFNGEGSLTITTVDGPDVSVIKADGKIVVESDGQRIANFVGLSQKTYNECIIAVLRIGFSQPTLVSSGYNNLGDVLEIEHSSTLPRGPGRFTANLAITNISDQRLWIGIESGRSFNAYDDTGFEYCFGCTVTTIRATGVEICNERNKRTQCRERKSSIGPGHSRPLVIQGNNSRGGGPSPSELYLDMVMFVLDDQNNLLFSNLVGLDPIIIRKED